MKNLYLLLFCFLSPWTATQAQVIRFLGGNRSRDFYVELVRLLDRGRMVEYSAGGRVQYVYDPLGHPLLPDPQSELWVMDMLPPSWQPWPSQIDTFVPEVKGILAKSGHNPRLIYLLLPRVDPSSPPAMSAQYIPLVKQVARESGANVIDLNDPAFHTSDPQADTLRKLYITFVKVQHNDGLWHVVRATSEQSDEGPARNAIDNNPDTYWHTRYDPNPTKVPHDIVIDLGQKETLAGFSYLARQDGGVNGRVKDFEVYLGDDPDHWAAPALKGTLQNTMNEQRLLFDHPATGRYLRFRALSEVNGNIWTSVAELGIMRSGNSK